MFITGRRQSELDVATREIGKNITGIQGDIAKTNDLDRLFTTIKQEKGRLDILFANAGGGAFAPLEQVTEAHFDKYFGINVKGTLFTVQKALALMPAGGAIVINASMVSIKGIPAFGVYAATKAALRSFARTWSMDLKEGRNIRVNVVSPGTVVTPAYSQSELGLNDDLIAEMAKQITSNGPSRPAGQHPTKSRKPLCSWRPTTAVTSPASSSSWTAARHQI